MANRSAFSQRVAAIRNQVVPAKLRKAQLPSVSSPITNESLRANAILTGLEPHEIDALLERGELVELKLRDVIYRPDEQINDAFFPVDCVLSVVTQMTDGHQIEIGTIGREGVSGIPLCWAPPRRRTNHTSARMNVPRTCAGLGLPPPHTPSRFSAQAAVLSAISLRPLMRSIVPLCRGDLPARGL